MGKINTVTFKFQPSRDIGIAPNSTFKITAPPGFVLVKRAIWGGNWAFGGRTVGARRGIEGGSGGPPGRTELSEESNP